MSELRALANVLTLGRFPVASREVIQAADELDALRGKVARLSELVDRIATEYPAVAGPDNCPPAPHACPKCEIYYLLRTGGE